MAPRKRGRWWAWRASKWAGLVLFIALALLFIASARWVAGREFNNGLTIAAWGGQVEVLILGPRSVSRSLLCQYTGPFHWRFNWQFSPQVWLVVVPLWPLAGVAGGLTLLAFALDRAHRFRGRCF